METLKEQIETLTKLMASLDIPGEEKAKEEADVVYDYSSDDENPYDNPYNNFGTKRKQSYVEDDFQQQFIYGPPSLEENYLYRQGVVKNKQNKWINLPPQYIPKLSTIPTTTDVLSIDCITNPEARSKNGAIEWEYKYN